MHLRKYVGVFGGKPCELGDLKQIEGFGACLFQRIVEQNGVGLIPAAANGSVWVRIHDLWLRPHGGQALVDLYARVVVCRREVEAIARPDEQTPLALLGGEQLGDHPVDVFGPRRRPDGNVKGVEAVGEELARVGTLDEVEGALLVRTEQEGAVEVYDEEHATRFRQGDGLEEGLRDVMLRRIGHAARGLARGQALSICRCCCMF